MPYNIEKHHGMFYLYKTKGHDLLGKHPSLKKAQAQQTAIIMSELKKKNPKK